ncbi:MAG: hypothetical protein K2X03_23235 [Bryobacteraceae bacterium]|nr:hypothetical protein [Bryobacteraceae bacterium]
MSQNYANHAQRVPVFLAAGIVLLLTVIGACVNMYQSFGDHERMYNASLVLVLSLCALVIWFYARTFALKAQDRAIRAEENLRHFAMTGKLLDSRLETLQIVALRFASDGEFVELAKKAAEQGTAPKDIKQAIKNWRPDLYRA